MNTPFERNHTSGKVIELLTEASNEKDYPQAEQMLHQVLAGERPQAICHCRRFLYRNLGGAKACRLHRG